MIMPYHTIYFIISITTFQCSLIKSVIISGLVAIELHISTILYMILTTGNHGVNNGYQVIKYNIYEGCY